MSNQYGVRNDHGKPSPSNGTLPASVPNVPQTALGVSQNPTTVYQQIHEVSAKRISTLDYLRKVYDGHVYWYNTLFFTKADMAKMPFFETKKLARRATNYLLLGLSIPNILDLSSANAQEYLRALNTLLAEFESYQQSRSPEGISASSLSRAKIPQMFKRATHTGGAKGRRTSSAADIGLPMGSNDHADQKHSITNMNLTTSTSLTFAASDQDLMPGEDFTYLLTPALPFDPDFFETFATLCEVLIDCYSRITALIHSPAVVAPGTGEVFAKADARVRKILVANVVKEFEDASRSGTKSEFGNLRKVLMGGLV